MCVVLIMAFATPAKAMDEATQKTLLRVAFAVPGPG